MPHTETAFTYDLCPTAQASTGDAWAHSEQEPTDLRLGELLEHFVRPFPVLLSPPVCQPANKLQNTHLTAAERQESSSLLLNELVQEEGLSVAWKTAKAKSPVPGMNHVIFCVPQ